MERNKNLLFGLLAIQHGKLSPQVMVQGSVAWTTARGMSLADYLVQSGSLDTGARAAVEAETADIIARHGGNADAALRSLVGDAFEDADRLDTIFLQAVPAPFDSGSNGPEKWIDGVQEAPGRYRRAIEYAVGGMGRILRVHDEFFGREIALKELYVNNGEPVDSDYSTRPNGNGPRAARFVQEARIGAQLEHPSIVPIYEMGHREDGTLYYTMKLVRGKTLGDALRESRNLNARLKLMPHFVDLCQAIAYAHSRGVLHRDIKPENVMVGEFGETVVIDWGLAKKRDEQETVASEGDEFEDLEVDDDEVYLKTQYGQVVGTPSYMSPEQARGQLDSVSERSDVYSLGALLYELLTGHAPFTDKTKSNRNILRMVVETPPTPITELERNAPLELVTICRHAMQPHPARRYASAKELAEEINRWQIGEPVARHRYSLSAKAVRVARRNSTFVTAAAVALIVGLSSMLYFSMHLYHARNVEREQRMALEAANTQQEWDKYALTLTSAQKHIDDGHHETAATMLRDTPPRLRGWEWGRLHRITQPAVLELYDEEVPGGAWGFPGRVEFSADDRYLLAHRWYSGLRQVYDFKSGRNRYLAELPADNPTTARRMWHWCTRLHPSGDYLSAGYDQHALGLWALDDDEPEVVLPLDGHEPRRAAFSPDGNLLAAIGVAPGNRLYLYVWQVDTGARVVRQALRRVEGLVPYDPDMNYNLEEWTHRMNGTALLEFFDDSRRIAFADTHVGVFDIGSGDVTRYAPCIGLAGFHPESGRVVTLVEDSAVEVWNLNDGTKKAGYPLPVYVEAIEIHPEGDRFITSGETVAVWDMATGKQTTAYNGPSRSPSCNSNGAALATIRGRGWSTLQVWDMRRHSVREPIPLHSAKGKPLQFQWQENRQFPFKIMRVTDHEPYIVAAEPDGYITIWNRTRMVRYARWQADRERLYHVSFGSEDRLLATCGTEGVKIWDARSGRELQHITNPPGHVATSASFHPTLHHIAVGYALEDGLSNRGEKMAKVYDRETGELLYAMAEHPGACRLVRFTPGGRYLMTGRYGSHSMTDDPSLLVWEAKPDGTLMGTVDSINWPTQVEFVPGRNLALVLGLSIEPVLYDLETHEEVWRIKTGEARQLVAHPDGDRFVAVRRDGYAVHAIKDGALLGSFREGTTPGFFGEEGRTLFLNHNNREMFALKTEPWSFPSREAHLAHQHHRTRMLLGLTDETPHGLASAKQYVTNYQFRLP